MTILQYLKREGLTMQDMADDLRVSVHTVRRWSSRKSKMRPKYERALQVVKWSKGNISLTALGYPDECA